MRALVLLVIVAACSPSQRRTASIGLGAGVAAIGSLGVMACDRDAEPSDGHSICVGTNAGFALFGIAAVITGLTMKVPAPEPTLAEQREATAMQLAASVLDVAREGQCDRALEAASRVRTLDAAVHAALVRRPELASCVAGR